MSRQPRRRRVLILYPTATFIDPLLKIAASLQRDGEFDVIIYSHSWYPGFEDSIRRAGEIGVRMLCFMNPDRKSYRKAVDAIDDLGLPVTIQPRSRKTVDVKRAAEPKHFLRLMRFFRMISFLPSVKAFLADFERAARMNASILTRADLIIDRLGIDLLIVPTESLSHQSNYFIESMKIVGRRSIYFPMTVSSHDEIDAWLSNTKNGKVRSVPDRVFAFWYPQWKRKISGTTFLRLPTAKALAFERDGLVPGKPWLSFTMRSDVIACASPFIRDRLVELGAGYRRKSMLVTGSAEDAPQGPNAEEVASLRRDLVAMLELDPNKPILLFSAPSNVSNQYPLVDFASFEELIAYWCNSLRSLKNISVITSPHPWYRNNKDGERLLDEVGLNVVRRGVIELMPAVDIFTTFGASSTPRLAAAAGLPVLNYLAFKTSFSPVDARSYFVGFETMPVATSRAEWEALLRRIDEADYREDLCRRARDMAGYFGPPGGAFAQRFLPAARLLAGGRGALSKKERGRLRRLCSDREEPSSP